MSMYIKQPTHLNWTMEPQVQIGGLLCTVLIGVKCAKFILTPDLVKHTQRLHFYNHLYILH